MLSLNMYANLDMVSSRNCGNRLLSASLRTKSMVSFATSNFDVSMVGLESRGLFFGLQFCGASGIVMLFEKTLPG